MPRYRANMKDGTRSGVRIVHNKVLGGWYVVRGPHDTPISGKFDSKYDAQEWLRRRANPHGSASERDARGEWP